MNTKRMMTMMKRIPMKIPFNNLDTYHDNISNNRKHHIYGTVMSISSLLLLVYKKLNFLFKIHASCA